MSTLATQVYSREYTCNHEMRKHNDSADIIHLEKETSFSSWRQFLKLFTFFTAGESSKADRAAARPGRTGLSDPGQQRVHPGRLSPETFKEGLPAEDVLLGQLLLFTGWGGV